MVSTWTRAGIEKGLGIMTARQQGKTAMADWRQRLDPIEVHRYDTPNTRGSNRENPYSLGILNLTVSEALCIAEFAKRVQAQRSVPTVPATTMAASGGSGSLGRAGGRSIGDVSYNPVTNTTEVWAGPDGWIDMAQNRKNAEAMLSLTDARDVPIEEPTPEPVKGNRFSGLDIE